MSELLLTDYIPKSMLELEEHRVEMPKFSVIDIHNHLGKRGKGWAVPDVDKLVCDMDSCGVEAIVNVDGGWGDLLRENLERYKGKYPGRFAVFAWIDWREIDRDFGKRAAEQSKLFLFLPTPAPPKEGKEKVEVARNEAMGISLPLRWHKDKGQILPCINPFWSEYAVKCSSLGFCTLAIAKCRH